MNIWIRFLIVFMLTIAFKWTFCICYHFIVKQVITGKSDDGPNQLYIFLKYFSFVLLIIFFYILLGWNVINLSQMLVWQKCVSFSFLLFLLGYYQSSLGLLNHLITLVYLPKALSELTASFVFGDVKKQDGDLWFIHYGSHSEINLSKELE